MPKQIIALGGGGFSMEDTPALDRYILAQTNTERPRVCFLPQASGDNDNYIARFYHAFNRLGYLAGHLALINDATKGDLADYLLSFDVLYVGGGSTKSMLALWREWGIDTILRRAYDEGIVLAGISAGAICWFEQGLTDSIPDQLTALPCLGLLPGSATPHYDGESERRPSYLRMVGAGEISGGYALQDSAAAHFVDGELINCACSQQGKQVFRVERDGDQAVETPLAMLYVGE